MIGILKNQNGTLSIALLLAVVGMMSGLTMSGVALRDTRAFLAEYESIQGLHFLRTEAYRGQKVLESNENLTGVIFTPVRNIGVAGSHLKRTFTMQSKIFLQKAEQTDVVIITGGPAATGSVGEQRDHYLIQSLIEAKYGIGQAAYYGANKSLVRKYGELTVIQENFAQFMYFTDQDTSPAGKNVYFYGPDVLTGKVHSNTDIRIKQAGGGNNNGWPTFLNLVTTGGVIDSTPSNYPLATVFRGGLVENYDAYEFPPLANELRNRGHHIGAGQGSIYWVKVTQSSYDMWEGRIIPSRKFASVTNPYPPPGDTLWINNFSAPDTTWYHIGGTISAGRPTFVNGVLWLEGAFQGYQTWGSSDHTYLTGDVTLWNTQIPNSPMDNSTDIVGIVSEKSIIVKYGYRSPVDSTRIHPNMGADNEFPEPAGGGIFIYAAVCALGDDGEVPAAAVSFNSGVFTYEYMHPHPSTPTLRVQTGPNVVYYDWIDLHRRHYPPTGTTPWPTPALGQDRLDLPWYNPLWPERSPYLERGTINVWGAIAQRRRGFVHRSGNDGEYPSNSGDWDIENDICGHPTAPQLIVDPVFGNQINMISQHYPGASGSGTGYRKNYNYDNRFLTRAPLLYPNVNLKGGKKPLAQGNWNIRKPVRGLF